MDFSRAPAGPMCAAPGCWRVFPARAEWLRWIIREDFFGRFIGGFSSLPAWEQSGLLAPGRQIGEKILLALKRGKKQPFPFRLEHGVFVLSRISQIDDDFAGPNP